MHDLLLVVTTVEYLQKNLRYDWNTLLNRTKQEDEHLVDSDKSHADSNDRLAVARILRKAIPCAGYMGSPEFR